MEIKVILKLKYRIIACISVLKKDPQNRSFYGFVLFSFLFKPMSFFLMTCDYMFFFSILLNIKMCGVSFVLGSAEGSQTIGSSSPGGALPPQVA